MTLSNTTVWILLLVLTAVEVALAYVRTPPALMLASLLGLSLLKAALIVGYFMHMKFERRSLKLAIFPALIIVILALFGILPDAKAQCSMCQRNAAAQSPDQVRRLNLAISVMGVPPMLIMGGILWRMRRGPRTRTELTESNR